MIWMRRMVLAGLAAMALPGVAWAQGLTGAYVAEGRNPDGSAYNGFVSIVDADGHIGMSWRVGSQSYTGKGVLAGRVLTVEWGSDSPVVYVLMPDGSLQGTWARGRALELLTPD